MNAVSPRPHAPIDSNAFCRAERSMKSPMAMNSFVIPVCLSR